MPGWPAYNIRRQYVRIRDRGLDPQSWTHVPRHLSFCSWSEWSSSLSATWYTDCQPQALHRYLCHGRCKHGDRFACKLPGWPNDSSRAMTDSIYPKQPCKAHRGRTSRYEWAHHSDRRYALPESAGRSPPPAPDSVHEPTPLHRQIAHRTSGLPHSKYSIE